MKTTEFSTTEFSTTEFSATEFSTTEYTEYTEYVEYTEREWVIRCCVGAQCFVGFVEEGGLNFVAPIDFLNRQRSRVARSDPLFSPF
jgi:hypothetical protein